MRLFQKWLVCSLNKNNKNQLRRRMEKCPLKDDYETEVLFNQSSDQSKPASHTDQELTTINAIMDQIHQEVISTKVTIRGKDNQERKVQCKKWGRKETENFYLLLSKIGPDFTNMELHQIFSGNRCKRQLKNKYRKEQKNNGAKVNSFLDIYYDRTSQRKIVN